METVAEGVHRLGSRFVNLYVIESGGALTVVDTGMPGYYDGFLDALVEIGRSIADIRAIVLTHNHSDHVGFAERLRSQGPPVLIHEVDAPGATGAAKVATPKGRPLDLMRPGIVTFVGHAVRNGGFTTQNISEVTTFTDGEVLDVPGSLRVVFAPGHSPGHCALLMEQGRILFAGDGLVTLTPWSGQTGPQLMKINADRREAIRSLDVYERVDADLLLPGHGDPWRGSVADAARTARSGVSG